MTSILLAKMFSLYLFILGGALLLNKNYYQTTIVELTTNGPVNFCIAALSLIIGIILIVFHNVWVLGWPVIITIFSWIFLLKGIARLVFPRMISKWIDVVYNNIFYCSICFSLIVLGIYLGYHGFIR